MSLVQEDNNELNQSNNNDNNNNNASPNQTLIKQMNSNRNK